MHIEEASSTSSSQPLLTSAVVAVAVISLPRDLKPRNNEARAWPAVWLPDLGKRAKAGPSGSLPGSRHMAELGGQFLFRGCNRRSSPCMPVPSKGHGDSSEVKVTPKGATNTFHSIKWQMCRKSYGLFSLIRLNVMLVSSMIVLIKYWYCSQHAVYEKEVRPLALDNRGHTSQSIFTGTWRPKVYSEKIYKYLSISATVWKRQYTVMFSVIVRRAPSKSRLLHKKMKISSFDSLFS